MAIKNCLTEAPLFDLNGLYEPIIKSNFYDVNKKQHRYKIKQHSDMLFVTINVMIIMDFS